MENMANWDSVICQGDFEEVTDSAEREKGIHLLLDRSMPYLTSETVHLTPNWPFSTDKLDKIDGIIFRIKLKEKSGRYETSEKAMYYAS